MHLYKVLGGDGREYGPAGPEEVRQWLAEGRLHPQSLAQRLPETNWRPLHNFPELAGTPPPMAFQPMRSSPSNGMALWGFIFGVLSLLGSCLCCCAFPVNILAIVLSTIGLAQASRERDSSSQTLAIVGLVLGLVSLIESVAASVVAVLTNVIAHAAR